MKLRLRAILKEVASDLEEGRYVCCWHSIRMDARSCAFFARAYCKVNSLGSWVVHASLWWVVIASARERDAAVFLISPLWASKNEKPKSP